VNRAKIKVITRDLILKDQGTTMKSQMLLMMK